LSDSEPFKSYKLDHTDLKRLRDGHVGGQVRSKSFLFHKDNLILCY